MQLKPQNWARRVKILEVFLENLELDAELQIPHHDGLALS